VIFSVKKTFLLVSFCLGAALILLSEKSADFPQINTLQKTAEKIDVEHNIILDLKSKTDRVIYDNLIFSSYYCVKLNPKQARCSQFKASEKQIVASTKSIQELYSYTSEEGQALRVYETKNGAAHLEFKESGQGVLHRYTFTSVEKASDFASQNKDLFETENFSWDISYLDYIL